MFLSAREKGGTTQMQVMVIIFDKVTRSHRLRPARRNQIEVKNSWNWADSSIAMNMPTWCVAHFGPLNFSFGFGWIYPSISLVLFHAPVFVLYASMSTLPRSPLRRDTLQTNIYNAAFITCGRCYLLSRNERKSLRLRDEADVLRS